MSRSLLYHAFGVRGYRYERTKYQGGKVILTIGQTRESYCCAACGSGDVIGKGKKKRTFRTLPIGGKTLRRTGGHGTSYRPARLSAEAIRRKVRA